MALSKLDSTALGTLSGDIVFASGQGIDFSATSDGSGTMSSELFHDYEEGTWTPTDVSGDSLTLVVYAAVYTKIGDTVFFQTYFAYPTTALTSIAAVGGLPYTAKNIVNLYGGVSLPYSNSTTIKSGLVTANSTYFDIRNTSGNQLTNAGVSGLSTIAYGFYKVA